MKYKSISSVLVACPFTILASAYAAQLYLPVKLADADSNNAIKTEYTDDEASNSDDSVMNLKLIDDNRTHSDDGDYTPCWTQIGIPELFRTLNGKENKYSKHIGDFIAFTTFSSYEKAMREEFVKKRGAAYRAIHNFDGKINLIPAGINLLDNGLVVLKDSVLFFHRLKVQEATKFHLKFFNSSLDHWTLHTEILIPKLTLKGSYERAISGRELSHLIYQPTYGEISILLTNVTYKMEGRYRLRSDHLNIENMVSEIKVEDAQLAYELESPDYTDKVDPENIGEFLKSLKTGLDIWLKDYFNDYLAFVNLAKASTYPEFQEYQNMKTMILNEFIDSAVEGIANRLRELNLTESSVPDFSIYTPNGMVLKLKSGVLRGLTNIHRRSSGTVKKDKVQGQVEATVSFSDLKLEYKYECRTQIAGPVLNGRIVYDASDILSLLSLSLVSEPESFNLLIEPMYSTRTGSLTVGGPLNREMGSFKHLIENFVQSIMFYYVLDPIRSLKYITACKAANFIHGFVDPDDGNNNGAGGDDVINNNNNTEVRDVQQNKYKINKQDSVEIQLPPHGNEKDPKTYKIKYNEELSFAEAGK